MGSRWDAVAAPGTPLAQLTRGATVAVETIGADDGTREALTRALAVHGAAIADGPNGIATAKVAVLLCDDATDTNTLVHAIQTAKRFAQGGIDGRAFVVVQDHGGCFAGLARTAAVEWPAATVRLIEVAPDSAEQRAKAIHGELIQGGDAAQIRLSGSDTRLSPADAVRPLAVGALPLPDDAVLLVTGGARGVTAACAIALARQSRCRFALIRRGGAVDDPAALRSFTTERELIGALAQAAQAKGEKATPAALTAQARAILGAREAAATVAAIEAAGSQAMLIAADVAQVADVARAVGEVRRTWGRIDGIVHGAGVLADRLIIDKTEDQARMVIDAKLTGLHHLLDATAGDTLRAIVLFSSVAGRYGNLGQVDYAMANAGLVAVAEAEARKRGAGCVVRAIDWGAWDGGMVTDSLRANFARQGVPLIDLGLGAQAFAAEILSGSRAAEDVHIALVPQQAAANPSLSARHPAHAVR